MRPAKYEQVSREVNQQVTNNKLSQQKAEEDNDMLISNGLPCADNKESQSTSEKKSFLPQHEIQANLQGSLNAEGQEAHNMVSESEVAWPRLLNDAWAIERNVLQPLSEDINDIQEQVETSCKINIRSITWNQQAQEFPSIETLREQLFSPGYVHAVAVGTQECENSISKSMLYPSKNNWERACGEALGSAFTLVRGHSLQASHLVVFVHRAILHLVSDVNSVAVATGLCDKLGNKGGIGITMTIGRTKLCFLTAHLAAHQNQMDRRTAEFGKISREVSRNLGEEGNDNTSTELHEPIDGEVDEAQDAFEDNDVEGASNHAADSNRSFTCSLCSKVPNSVRQCSLCCYSNRGDDKYNPLPDAFDQIIWAGDFNFRIHGTRDIVDSLLHHNRYDILLDNDQLIMLMQFDKAFVGFTEGPLTFRPTYKFDKNSDVYDTSAKRRIPAWTDRILYKPNSSIELLSYASVDSVRTSDHRPVVASFRCSLDLGENNRMKDYRMPLLRSESKSEVCIIS